MYWQLFILATIGSVISLAGGILLLANRRLAARLALISAPFAAGALVAAAFYDLLPEAVETATEPSNVLLMAAVGVLLFFLLERRLKWFHHHHEHEETKQHHDKHVPIMIVVGDTLHNAMDGMAIAVAFLVDPAIGITTTIAISLHELPQEIGDFGILLNFGWSRKKVLLANLLSALATIVAATIVYIIGSSIESLLGPLLGLTAGALIYIACSDIVPEVHQQRFKKWWKDQASILFILGMTLVIGATYLLHQLVEH